MPASTQQWFEVVDRGRVIADITAPTLEKARLDVAQGKRGGWYPKGATVRPRRDALPATRERRVAERSVAEGFAGDPPTAPNILEWFGTYMEDQGFDAPRESARLARLITNRTTSVHDVLEEANRLIGGYGVEAIHVEGAWINNYYGDIVATYVNTGDSYSATLLHESETGRFVLTTWGDWFEANERKYLPEEEEEEEPDWDVDEARRRPRTHARKRGEPSVELYLQSIYDAPMWTVFQGKPPGKPIAKRYWILSDISANMSEEAADGIFKRGYESALEEPELDDEAVYGTALEGKGDELAWLAFLAQGGMLMKVPDEVDPHHPNHKYYRLIAVEKPARRR